MTDLLMRTLPDAIATRTLAPNDIRSRFLVENLFVEGAIALELVDLDRVILGAAIPLKDALTLPTPAAIRSNYFCERRELGILNIGGPGSVSVDNDEWQLGVSDVLYVGRGAQTVRFGSEHASNPARFYIVSYPAHATHPTARVRASEASATELGSTENANRRTVRRYIHLAGARSAQLVMGVTTLAPGSVWNTMPVHTHDRRTEVYLYFNLAPDAMLVHLMGEPEHTQHLIVRNEQVALSPGWSIHCGCGTSAYSFCWAMGGENQDYADMDPVSMETLR